jgi:hypothetical protein
VNPTRTARFCILLAAWISATGAIGTCDYFKPATPETPNRPPIIADYSSPTLALETIAKGIEDKSTSNGQEVYMGAFADSSLTGGDGRAFHAFFDPLDLRDHPSWDPNRDWNRDLERVLYSDLVRRYGNPYQMSWEPYEPAGNESGSGTDSLLHRKYRIMQVLPGGARSPVAIGAADLYFVRSQITTSRWVMVHWQDYHTLDADSAQVTLGKRRLDTQ